MPRSRNIKPAFFQNEDLGDLPPLARLLFIGLWTIADFKGCVINRPKRIKAQLLPYDECDIKELLNNLEQSGFIASYSVQDENYIKIRKFEKHQNPHKNEKEKGSDIPEIPINTAVNEESRFIAINPEQNRTNRADSLFLLPDSLDPEIGDDALEKPQDPRTLLSGRSGIPRNLVPINPSSDLELQGWLAPIAAAVGARSVSGLPKRTKWEAVCMTAIQEQRDLPQLLKIIESEKKRLGDDLQFFSPEICLQKLQMNGTRKEEKLPTLAEKLADDQANRQNLRKAPTAI